MPLVHHASTTMAGSSAPLPRSSATLLCRSTSRAPLLLSWLLGDSSAVHVCCARVPYHWKSRLLGDSTPLLGMAVQVRYAHAQHPRGAPAPLYAATSAPLPRPSTPLPALLYHAPLRRYQRSYTTPLYAATSAPIPRPSTPLPALLYHAPLRRYQRSYTTPLYAATSAPLPRPSTPLALMGSSWSTRWSTSWSTLMRSSWSTLMPESTWVSGAVQVATGSGPWTPWAPVSPLGYTHTP
jgi:hypothetical protein